MGPQRWRALLAVVTIALFSVACSTSTRVNSADVEPTPLPTLAPVFVPTTPPAPPTPAAAPGEDAATADGEAPEADASAGNGDESNDAAQQATTARSNDDEPGHDAEQATPTPTPTAAATPTPTADVIPVPTHPPRPQPRPTPRPTLAPAPICPGGQVLGSNGLCSCPAGTASRPGDGLCVRFCNQAELTISNSCVCAGELYDNGGQCVKRCTIGEVPDGFGGCKFPDPAAVN